MVESYIMSYTGILLQFGVTGLLHLVTYKCKGHANVRDLSGYHSVQDIISAYNYNVHK